MTKKIDIRDGERIIPGTTLTVPTTPPFGGGSVRQILLDSYGTDQRDELDMLSDEDLAHAVIDRLKAEIDARDEARAKAKTLHNAIEETREQLFICLPEAQHDEWTRFFEPHHLAGMAVATLDHIAESNAQVVEQAQADAAKARKYIEAREKAWAAFTQRLNLILDMINLEVESGMTHAQRNGANQLWRGLLDMALRQWKVRQRGEDDLLF
jgi:hypothetical protein